MIDNGEQESKIGTLSSDWSCRQTMHSGPRTIRLTILGIAPSHVHGPGLGIGFNGLVGSTLFFCLFVSISSPSLSRLKMSKLTIEF